MYHIPYICIILSTGASLIPYILPSVPPHFIVELIWCTKPAKCNSTWVESCYLVVEPCIFPVDPILKTKVTIDRRMINPTISVEVFPRQVGVCMMCSTYRPEFMTISILFILLIFHSQYMSRVQWLTMAPLFLPVWWRPCKEEWCVHCKCVLVFVCM